MRNRRLLPMILCRRLFTFLLLSSTFLAIQSLQAQFYVPIAGEDDTHSQYTCVRIPNGPSSVLEIKKNGSTKTISTKAAQRRIARSVRRSGSRVRSLKQLIRRANKKQKKKLRKKLRVAQAKLRSIRYIQERMRECAKGELLIGAGGSPVFLSTTFEDPNDSSKRLSGFNYGFLFTPPKQYKGDDYCVIISGAEETLTGIGGISYNTEFESSTSSVPQCRSRSGISFCVEGMQSDEVMVLITGGIITEDAGNCSPEYRCSITELAGALSNHYSSAILNSIRANPGGGACN